MAKRPARERIEFETGWAEWDRGPFVTVGDRALPQRIEVVFPSSTFDKWPALEMTIEVRRGAPQCTRLTLRSHPEGREVRGVDFAHIHLEDWVETITAEAAMEIFTAADGSTLLRKTLSSGGRSREVEEQARAARRAIRAARSGARRKVTDELLQQVAEIYRDNAADRPVEAISAAFHTSHRTAARYADLARKAGHLAPTSRGRVST